MIILSEKKDERTPGLPKHAWQVTKKDIKHLKPKNIRQMSDTIVTERLGKATVAEPYQNRHKVQKEVEKVTNCTTFLYYIADT